MRRLLLSLLFISMVGCETTQYYRETEEYKQAVKDRKAMLTDGRIHIGMTDGEFAKLWHRPGRFWIDRSVSVLGVTEWWWFDRDCEFVGPGTRYSKYAFCFENGILTYWSEN